MLGKRALLVWYCVMNTRIIECLISWLHDSFLSKGWLNWLARLIPQRLATCENCGVRTRVQVADSAFMSYTLPTIRLKILLYYKVSVFINITSSYMIENDI